MSTQTKLTAKKSTAAKSRTAKPVLRRPGRPSKDASTSRGLTVPAAVTSLLTREQILEAATELAKAEPLAELSMVGLARALNVTPALIHYYVGSRDDLISGVVNRYFRARIEQLAPPTGVWRTDLERFARITYEQMVEYGGVLRYIVGHNRHRLFQKVAPGETDYGVEFFDACARIFRDGGFNAKHSALGYHLIMQFVVGSAHAQVARQLPGDHEAYVYDRLQATSASRYPGAHYVARAFSRLDAETVFDAGLAALLDAFARWRGGAAECRG